MLKNLWLMSYGLQIEVLAPAAKKTKRRLKKLAKKEDRQYRKNRRLLEKMGINPKQGCCSYKPSWMLPHAYPGGVNAMGLPKHNRQTDTRRVPESFPRGYKISLVEVLDQYGDLLNNRTEFLPRLVRKIRIRKMLGNRNGSEKKWVWRTREEKPIPRSAARLEIQQELASIAEQEKEDLAELAKLDKEMLRDYQEWLEQENQRQKEREVQRGIEAEELDRERELYLERLESEQESHENESLLQFLRDKCDYAGNHDRWD